MSNMLLFSAAIVSCLVGSRLDAQGKPGTSAATATTATARADSTLATDRWLSRPTPITLTPAQRAKYDTLRTGLATAMNHIRTEQKPGGEMAAVMKVRKVTQQYQMYVRAMLTPAQQSIFDSNVKADAVGR